jgi:hypothetical protein
MVLNQVSSGVYSLAWLLFLWAGLAAFNLLSELRQRIRGFALARTKVQVALRIVTTMRVPVARDQITIYLSFPQMRCRRRSCP